MHPYKIDLELMSFWKEHHLKICKKYKTEQHLDTAFEFLSVQSQIARGGMVLKALCEEGGKTRNLVEHVPS